MKLTRLVLEIEAHRNRDHVTLATRKTTKITSRRVNVCESAGNLRARQRNNVGATGRHLIAILSADCLFCDSPTATKLIIALSINDVI